jgi:hypothetical protein
MKFTASPYPDPEELTLKQKIDSRLWEINERELSDPQFAQQVFLLKNRDELSLGVERELVQKVLQDIDHILKIDCAQEISENDFNHVHLCNVTKTPIFNIDALLSSDNVGLLYHTCEMYTIKHDKRNIKSSLVSQPEIIPVEKPKISVYVEDLGWSAYGKIEFEKNQDGHYRLKDGTRLNMKGILLNYLCKFWRDLAPMELSEILDNARAKEEKYWHSGLICLEGTYDGSWSWSCHHQLSLDFKRESGKKNLKNISARNRERPNTF